jgi:hypothetical protein
VDGAKTEESQKMKAFFRQGNQMTPDALVNRFEKGGS